ncbi:unnamed protein product [Caenorhabditis sp. 36 PRJEB53466]|nr:unnamed protein product [Caenorhabditis sp. 36 PRJEB53466]
MEVQPILFFAAEGTSSEFETNVKKLEKRGYELLQARDEKGRNALFHAAITDNVKNFLYIIKKINIRSDDLLAIRDNSQATVLHWATQYSAGKVVREILAMFDNKAVGIIIEKDFEAVTPLHIAATKFDTKILRIFLDNLKYLPNTEEVGVKAQDKRNRSPLHYAASCANKDAIRVILDPNGPNFGFTVDQRDKIGIIPLMCAVGVNSPHCIQVIRYLEKKKPVSKTRQNRDGMTALHIAVAARNLDAVKLLIELECSIDLVDNEQRTPLHYAAEHGYPEIVEYLLSEGARNSTRDHIGATPAHYAAQFTVECLKIIFKQSRISEVKDNEQRSCLMWAVCAGNVDVINYLIQRDDAPDRRAIDKHGYTALHLAAMVGNEKVCKILINQGWSLSERDNHGNTALHLASGRGHTDVLRCLVASGAHMSDVDEVGRTAVFWACMGGQSHTLHCMIKELSFEWRTPGTNDTRPITDNFGRTALHAAANAGFSACINVLLNIEQEDNFLTSPLVGCRDKNGETALHVACAAGKFDCVLSLLKGGSAINAVGKTGNTPLDCAMSFIPVNQIIIDHLISEGAYTYDGLKETASTVIQRFWRRRIQLERQKHLHRNVYICQNL